MPLSPHLHRFNNFNRLASLLLTFIFFVSPAYAASDTFVQALLGDPTNLLPVLASDNASHAIIDKVYDSLLKYNPQMELEGELAESWEVLESGKVIVFHLKRNVKWHDGMPFTAHDVEFTYRKMIDPQIPSPYGSKFQTIERLEIIDDYTLRVLYKEALSPALSSWTLWIMPKHLLENENFLTTSYARHPVGTGPYKFGRWLSGERIDLIRNESYYDGAPTINRIIYRVIPDQTTMFMELYQENIDMMSLTPIQYSKLTTTEYFEQHYRRYRYPNLGYTYLAYNLSNPMFSDKDIRQALNRAVNKQEIIDGVLLSLGNICTGPFVPRSWAYNEHIQLQTFDPAEALRVLNQKGWIDTDNDGILDKDGKDFAFTIITNQGNFQRQQAAEIIQKRLREIGIEVRIQVVEWSAFIGNVVHKKEFDVVLLAWGLSLEPDPYDIWHSSKTGPGEFNFIGYNNPVVDQLIEQGRTEFDVEKRKKIYHEIHRILYEDQPYMFLFVPDELPILHERFENVELTPIGLGYDFNEWSVAEEDVKYARFVL